MGKEGFTICPVCGKKVIDFSDGTDFCDAKTNEYVATVCSQCYGKADDVLHTSICGEGSDRVLITRPSHFVLLGNGFMGFYEGDRSIISDFAAGKLDKEYAERYLESDSISEAKELMRSYAEYDRRMYQVVNLMRDDVKIVLPDGSVKTFPASGDVAFCSPQNEQKATFCGIPITKQHNIVIGLPEEQEYKKLIVPKDVAESCPNRKDLLFPGPRSLLTTGKDGVVGYFGLCTL